MWTMIKQPSWVHYNSEKQTLDFSNVFYHYYIYNEKEIALAESFANIGVAEQTYFLSNLDALVNSLGGTNRLVKILFGSKIQLQTYVKHAKQQGVTLPAHVEAAGEGGSIFSPAYVIPRLVETVADTAVNSANAVLKPLGFPDLKAVSKILIVAGIIFLAIFLFKQYKK